MFTVKTRQRAAAILGFAAVGLAIAAPAAQASIAREAHSPAGTYLFSPGQKLWVLYGNSPLRACPGTNCVIITEMPATTSLNPGGGWVTSLAYQNSSNAWCVIDYKNIGGWTGCWRLGVPA
jgi:hypothetical protein